MAYLQLLIIMILSSTPLKASCSQAVGCDNETPGELKVIDKTKDDPLGMFFKRTERLAEAKLHDSVDCSKTIKGNVGDGNEVENQKPAEQSNNPAPSPAATSHKEPIPTGQTKKYNPVSSTEPISTSSNNPVSSSSTSTVTISHKEPSRRSNRVSRTVASRRRAGPGFSTKSHKEPIPTGQSHTSASVSGSVAHSNSAVSNKKRSSALRETSP